MTSDKGLQAARRYAGWHIGDRIWADRIIHAYLNPGEANAEMDDDEIPTRTGAWR